jgi:hypothetical protein
MNNEYAYPLILILCYKINDNRFNRRAERVASALR